MASKKDADGEFEDFQELFGIKDAEDYIEKYDGF